MYPAPRDSLVTGEKYPYDRKDAKTSLISVVDQLQAGIAAKPNLSLSASVVSDVDVAGAIIKAGEDVEEGGGYEFIALSTHGRSGLERWKMGSITEQVLRLYDLPRGKCAGSCTTPEWKRYQRCPC